MQFKTEVYRDWLILEQMVANGHCGKAVFLDLQFFRVRSPWWRTERAWTLTLFKECLMLLCCSWFLPSNHTSVFSMTIFSTSHYFLYKYALVPLFVQEPDILWYCCVKRWVLMIQPGEFPIHPSRPRSAQTVSHLTLTMEKKNVTLISWTRGVWSSSSCLTILSR